MDIRWETLSLFPKMILISQWQIKEYLPPSSDEASRRSTAERIRKHWSVRRKRAPHHFVVLMRVIIFELLCIFRLFSFRSILFGNVSDLSFANGMTFCSKLQCPVVAILFVGSKDKEELSFQVVNTNASRRWWCYRARMQFGLSLLLDMLWAAIIFWIRLRHNAKSNVGRETVGKHASSKVPNATSVAHAASRRMCARLTREWSQFWTHWKKIII